MSSAPEKVEMTEARVCILDYGAGNVRSVQNLLVTLAAAVQVSNDRAAIRHASHLVLPGVGAFGAAMRRIRERIPLDVVEEEVLGRQKPFLGICVGMQVLADRGEEFGSHEGLGWVPGVTRPLDAAGLPLPHVGWNDLEVIGEAPLMRGLGASPDFYFVHSFVLEPEDTAAVIATAEYGSRFAAAVRRGNIFGVQFHPEKSQRSGQRLVRNFLDTQ